MSEKIQSVRGMNDLLPEDSGRWQAVEAIIRSAMSAYCYHEMRTPLIEKTGLFSRGIGEATDIVEKEMYTFPDRKGESLTLRPENTAGCVRAAIQHGMMAPGSVSRIWYIGPMFRYERPQQGRSRQFHQVGAEVYGVAGPQIEAELILLSARLWKALGIAEHVSLELNTLGTADERAAYREQLVSYFRDHSDQLDEDSTRRLETNPLRILDSKNPDLQALNQAAPKLADSLGGASQDHFETLKATLEECGVGVTLNPRLVRGLDYYSHSVWEWTTDLLGAQATVCGGGRYDGLVEQLGGKPCPAVGWALGMERLLSLVAGHSENTLPQTQPHLYFIVSDEVPAALAQREAEWLRNELPGLRLVQNATSGSIKAQFKRADKSGAEHALVIGAEEMRNEQFTLKTLRASRGDDQQLSLARDELKKHLSATLDLG